MRKVRGRFDRKVLVRQLVETGEELTFGVIHVKVQDKGLLITRRGLVFSYSLEFCEGKLHEDGKFELRFHDAAGWGLVYNGRFFCPFNGLCEEKGRSVRFKGDYPPYDRSFTLGKHVITFTLFSADGLDVLHTLGSDRIAILRCKDKDRNNVAYDNYEVLWYMGESEAEARRCEYLAWKRNRLRRCWYGF